MCRHEARSSLRTMSRCRWLTLLLLSAIMRWATALGESFGRVRLLMLPFRALIRTPDEYSESPHAHEQIQFANDADRTNVGWIVPARRAPQIYVVPQNRRRPDPPPRVVFVRNPMVPLVLVG